MLLTFTSRVIVIDMATFPTLRSTIERRLLVSYRADPEVVGALLPAPFTPQIVHGFAVVGICAIRIAHTRTRGVPGAFGFRSENAAHRIAVEWDDGGVHRTGVYIPRRDTNSRLNTFAGGRLFSGELGHARFGVVETANSVAIEVVSDDGAIRIDVEATIPNRFAPSALFESLEDASAFYQRGGAGYAPGRTGFSGTQLHTDAWQVEPAAIARAESSFFDDTCRFPVGSIELDSALVMRNIPVEWHTVPSLMPAQAARKDLARQGA
jgi:Uncharacterized conserved protein (COG2071)